MLIFSCTQKQETSADESNEVIEKDTLPRIEFNFPEEDLTFSIGSIPNFDTIYYGLNNFDSIQCKNYDFIIYTNGKQKLINNINDELFIPDGFYGLIFKQHKKNCNEGLPSEYSLIQRVKYELPPKGIPCYKSKRNNLLICEKIDTLDNSIWYSGSTFKDCLYVDFTAIYPVGDTIARDLIWQSIKRLKIKK